MRWAAWLAVAAAVLTLANNGDQAQAAEQVQELSPAHSRINLGVNTIAGAVGNNRQAGATVLVNKLATGFTAATMGGLHALGEHVSATSDGSTSTDSATALPDPMPAMPKPVFGGTQGDILPDQASTSTSDNSPGTTSLFAAKTSNFQSLLDVKALFMGLSADPIRRRSIIDQKCILNMRDLHIDGMCSTALNATTGACDSAWALPPMTVAMTALYKNLKTTYCKLNAQQCEPALCFTYGGTVDNDGMETATSIQTGNYPLWIPITGGNEIVYQQAKYKVSLEKVVFCERYAQAETVVGTNPKLSCHSARRCEVKEILHETCYNALANNVTGASVPCPSDADFRAKVAAKDTEVIGMLCANR